MKVHVIGGGPAGLYFAILMKKAWPATRITVFERNRPDDTFGFGVVFSDQTLDTFEAADPKAIARSPRHFAYWDDIEIHFKGTRAPHRRQRLLRLLAHDVAAAPAAARAARSASSSSSSTEYRRYRRRDRAMPISSSRPTASIRACAKPSPTTSSRASTCGRTTSPGWARRGRSTPSPSSSARPSTASSSRIATNTSRPLDLGDGDRSRDLRARRPRPARRGGVRATSSKAFSPTSSTAIALITNRSIWRNFPTIRCERWVAGQYGADRRRQGDRAFLHRLRHQARDGGRDRALRGVPRHRRARRAGGARSISRRAGARRSRRRSIPPTCRWSGSSTSSASGTWTRPASPSG